MTHWSSALFMHGYETCVKHSMHINLGAFVFVFVLQSLFYNCQCCVCRNLGTGAESNEDDSA